MVEPEFRATLYKDWDGVTNAHNPGHAEVLTVFVEVPDHPYILNPSKITFAPHVIREIDRLRENYSMELVWSTTWNHLDAVLRLPPLIGGLESGRVLPARLDHEAISDKDWTRWKAEGIIADQRVNPKPFVWIDDKAQNHWGDFVRAHTEAPSLMIQPKSEFGLTSEELLAMENFLQRI